MKKFILDRLPQLFIVLLVLFSYTLVYNHAKAIDFKYKEPLTATDKKSIIAFNILQTIDMLQTLEIANNDDYYEKNKVLGKHPSESHVVAYFVFRGFAHYHATNIIPQKYRNYFHGYNIIYNYSTIKDNHELGIRIDF